MDTAERQQLLREWTKPPVILAMLAMLVSILGAGAALVTGFSSVRNDVTNLARVQEQQDKRLINLESASRADHDLLIELRSDIKAVKQAVTGKP